MNYKTEVKVVNKQYIHIYCYLVLLLFFEVSVRFGHYKII